MFVEKCSEDLGMRNAPGEWIKSIRVRPCPYSQQQRRQYVPVPSGDVRWHKRHAEGPQVGQCVAWLYRHPAFPDRPAPQDSRNRGDLRQPGSDVTLMN